MAWQGCSAISHSLSSLTQGLGESSGANRELQGPTISSGDIEEACGCESLWKLNTEKPHLLQEVPDRQYLEIGRVPFGVSGGNAMGVHPALILHLFFTKYLLTTADSEVVLG